MSSERDLIARSLARQLVKLATPFHRSRLRDGELLFVYTTMLIRPAVSFLRVRENTQSSIGSLGVFIPFRDDMPVECEGVFYQYVADDHDYHSQQIEIHALTPEQAVERMINCLAPFFACESWPNGY